MNAITIRNLNRVYPDGTQVLHDLHMDVKENEIFALLGNNGAGKSTLINILTTYHPYTSGSAKVFDKEVKDHMVYTRKQIACVAQHTSIDEHLSLKENMMFQSRLYNIDKEIAKKRMNELIHNFGLESYVHAQVKKYSGGIKRRLDIAMSMMTHPKILFLDEPTISLDIESRIAIWNILLKIKQKYHSTIFLTSHYLEEVEYLSDTICILKGGKNLIQDTPEHLRKYMRQEFIQVILEDEASVENLQNQMSSFINNKDIKINHKTLLFKTMSSEEDLVKINQFLLSKKIPFISISKKDASLEDVYLSLTKEGEQ